MSEAEQQRSGFLRRQVIIRFSLAAALIPIIIYALAGTLHYWQGWLYWAVLVVPMTLAVTYHLKHDPELLERRMRYQEKEKEQQMQMQQQQQNMVIPQQPEAQPDK